MTVRNRGRFVLLAAALVFYLAGTFACRPEGEAEAARYKDAAAALLRKGLTELGAPALLGEIVSVGHRLTGSPQAAEAVEVARRLMEEMGLENVHLEPTTVGRWVRGGVECRLESDIGGAVPLDALAVGGSEATPVPGILAGVIEVRSFEELAAAGDKARGRIVFFNRSMDPAALDTFGAYGAAAEQRVRGAVETARAGGAAALVRSLTTSLDDYPHTGLMEYEEGTERVPAACLSTRSAERLSEALKRDPEARVFLRLECRRLDPVVSHNVVGDLTGTEKPEEIILLGGHLDSWDLGTGAHDDGAGCAHALEALRLLRELGLRPKRTVRAVMFMDEENGGTGGRDYARAEARRAEKHLAAIESDRGGFLPLGFGIGGDER
ncbi:MAG: M20/M25/M40 family metallo-hydrolase, partial [Candidatus Aminicenantes bacterium]|nr:M20/M25/M40 family metallo-hydrolase [Candidatus Aminicenantes bacterium]